MPTYRDDRVLKFTPQQLYDLVIDVESYPDFLPWCLDAKIIKRPSEHEFHARVTAGYLFAKESYLSRVIYDGRSHIQTEYLEGPFKALKNEWQFLEHAQGAELKFYVEFEFATGILNRLANHVLIEVTERMVNSFIKRAHEKYHTNTR